MDDLSGIFPRYYLSKGKAQRKGLQ